MPFWFNLPEMGSVACNQALTGLPGQGHTVDGGRTGRQVELIHSPDTSCLQAMLLPSKQVIQGLFSIFSVEAVTYTHTHLEKTGAFLLGKNKSVFLPGSTYFPATDSQPKGEKNCGR